MPAFGQGLLKRSRMWIWERYLKGLKFSCYESHKIEKNDTIWPRILWKLYLKSWKRCLSSDSNKKKTVDGGIIVISGLICVMIKIKIWSGWSLKWPFLQSVWFRSLTSRMLCHVWRIVILQYFSEKPKIVPIFGIAYSTCTAGAHQTSFFTSSYSTLGSFSKEDAYGKGEENVT